MDLIDLCKRHETLKLKFKQYAWTEDPKVEGCPVFTQGQENYMHLLEVNQNAILAMIDEEIKTWSHIMAQNEEIREEYHQKISA